MVNTVPNASLKMPLSVEDVYERGLTPHCWWIVEGMLKLQCKFSHEKPLPVTTKDGCETSSAAVKRWAAHTIGKWRVVFCWRGLILLSMYKAQCEIAAPTRTGAQTDTHTRHRRAREEITCPPGRQQRCWPALPRCWTGWELGRKGAKGRVAFTQKSLLVFQLVGEPV